MPLKCLGQTDERGEEGEGKERREKERGREEEKRIEKLLILSCFPRDLTVGVRRSKRQSSFLRKELRVETGIGEFRKTPKGRGFSYSLLFLA